MQSVFEYIQRHITQDSHLPEDFRLPEAFRLPGGGNGVRGGICRSPGAACRAALERLAEQLMACDTPEKGMELIAPVAARYPAVTAAGCLEEAIPKRLQGDSLYKLAGLARIGVWAALNAAEVECVKYGLVLCQITNVGEWSAAAEEIILTLGLCEEFTDFSALALHI